MRPWYLRVRHLGLCLLVVTLGPACRPTNPNRSFAARTDKSHVVQVKEVGIFWPPVDRSAASLPPQRALLHATLRAELNTSKASHHHQIKVRVIVTRPSQEEDRLAWNRDLAFADIDWMSEVRVWDASGQWLWPHLPYLLRIHGEDRVQRYGGIDPRKRVDNDFAAVVIRAYRSGGKDAFEATLNQPLVSAEWHPHEGNVAAPESLVHGAHSDLFEIDLGSATHVEQGQLRAWLIYADFLGARLPRDWDYPEFAGGTLAYYEIDWDTDARPVAKLSIRTLPPPNGTGFDWRSWANRPRGATRTRAVPRLACTLTP